MIIETFQPAPILWYRSSVHPDVVTFDVAYKDVIAWADAHPRAYALVGSGRSRAFGNDSSTYLGYHRKNGVAGTLGRLAKLREYAETDGGFFGFVARHSLEIFGQRGFRSALFVQHDGQYRRGCAHVDYLPLTLALCVKEFLAWCGDTFSTATVEIRHAATDVVTLKPPFLQER